MNNDNLVTDEVDLSNKLNQEITDLLDQIPDETKRLEIYNQAWEEYIAPDNVLPLVDILRKKVEEKQTLGPRP